MLPLRTILVPTDFSERSAHAFGLACALARDHGARLVVLHVLAPPAAVYMGVTPPEPDRSRHEHWEQLCRLGPRDPRVRVERLLAEGEPAGAILQAARDNHCDLIVMGTHGHTGLGRVLLGSVAEAVLRQAPCPVVTVRAPAPREPAAPVPEAAHAAD
jgi:nucleotide-binding universal stress UspA family protein